MRGLVPRADANRVAVALPKTPILHVAPVAKAALNGGKIMNGEHRPTDEVALAEPGGIGLFQDPDNFRRQRPRRPEDESKDAALAQSLRLSLDFGGWGRFDQPLYFHHTGIPTPIPEDPGVRHRDERIEESRSFTGTYNTELNGKELLIPEKWQELFKYGGVVAPGFGKYLMIFGASHWQRMVAMLGEQVGLDPDKNSVVRHILGRHVEFDELNPNGSITLSDDLIRYAELKPNIVAVGVIYNLEVYSDKEYDRAMLDPQDAKKLTQALSD
jgi:division/cell wall cluster transcriptional repressor MraZ